MTTGVGDFTPTITTIPSDVNLANAVTDVIPANSSVTFGPFTVTSPAYSVAVDALLNSAGTIGLLRVHVAWNDSATGLLVDEQRWYIPGTKTASPAGNTLTVGRGPTSADTVTIQVTNYDPAQAVTVDFAFWQSSRAVARHDWRTILQESGILPYSDPLTDSTANLLGFESVFSVGSDTTKTWQCALYAGQAQLWWLLSAVTNVFLQVIVPLPYEAAANQPNLYYTGAPLANDTLNLSLPRCPVLFQVVNDSAAAINVSWSLTVQEYGT